MRFRAEGTDACAVRLLYRGEIDGKYIEVSLARYPKKTTKKQKARAQARNDLERCCPDWMLRVRLDEKHCLYIYIYICYIYIYIYKGDEGEEEIDVVGSLLSCFQRR